MTLKRKPRLRPPKPDMMERHNISPWTSVGKILPTSQEKKNDIFASFRPEKPFVDYKISETWIKMQKGEVKLNVKHTSASYKEIPATMRKPQRNKKSKYYSGGPPQWEFIDEIWKEKVEEVQAELRRTQGSAFKKAQAKRKKTLEKVHQEIQNLVGPEWFMELNPKQYDAVNMLERAVYWDTRDRTTENCEDAIAKLGLVFNSIRTHIATALQHSCGDAVEFLLVLYQLIDPNRKMYSLNDRLLLSAVAHLTTTETLRELHVRIPSPPKVSEKTMPAKTKTKKKKYSSPYLEPLTFEPPSPKFTGVYENKHLQYPESPYFSYLDTFKQEKRSCLHHGMFKKYSNMPPWMTEYASAQEFYEDLPGVKEEMLFLTPATFHYLCPNMLNPSIYTKPANLKMIAPHLCKVTASEPVLCFCDENKAKGLNMPPQKEKRSLCEKSVQKLLGLLCFCDDCIEEKRQRTLIRIHGGLQGTTCKCDAPIPLIQGTLATPVCDCFKQYRNKIVGCAARQRLMDQNRKHIVQGTVMTKFGPIYTIGGTSGPKICNCTEIIQRKAQIKLGKDRLMNNKAKFIIGGITMTKNGPVYNLNAIVARKPCKCVLKYREKLNILCFQNKIRRHPVLFVNNGLVETKFGPVFHFGSVPAKGMAKSEEEMREVCSCEIKRSECFKYCTDYLEYKIATTTSSSDSCCSTTSTSSDTSNSSEHLEEQSSNHDSGQKQCPLCCKEQKLRQTPDNFNCPKERSTSTKPSKNTSTTKSEISTDEDYFKPKPCRCSDELDRFMAAKCQCEECNSKIRRGYATYVMGGTKTTASGHQVNIMQGIRQPLCSCMKDYLEHRRKIDEYKARVKARYELKTQQKKYCICGVRNTPEGPVYIISGLRPPVQCECSKAMREKEEEEAYEKKRAKPPNTGRIKYEIVGVKSMPEENIYIMSRALNIAPCHCEEFLENFEKAHKACFDQFDEYLQQTQIEIAEYMQEHEDIVGMDSEWSPYNEDKKLLEEQAYGANIGTPVYLNEENQLPKAPTQTFISQQEQPNYACARIVESSNEETDEESSSSDDESDSSEGASCHVENPPGVTPITMSKKSFPESFMSKRFAIFREIPKCQETMMKVLKHILEGMAEDHFPLAKLPQAYKLPIFKLWIDLRIGNYWTYNDKIVSSGISRRLWKHTYFCYKEPRNVQMPFPKKQTKTMTWKNARSIKSAISRKKTQFYRDVKHITVDSGREFFATTFPYQFPTHTWRECAFAYLPTKEANILSYKPFNTFEARIIAENKRFKCYC